jgi:hypothetical protein
LLAATDGTSEAKRHLQQALFLEDREADPIETLAWQREAKQLWKKIK